MQDASNVINIHASPLPFSNLRVHSVVPVGSTIQQMVDAYTGQKHHIDAAVFINDFLIPRENWRMIRPKAGVIVNIRVIPQGGGGGKKNPIASLLSIALLVAAPYAATALLGQTLASSTIIGSLTLGRVVGGVIGIVGNMLINAIAPPPKPSNSGSGNSANIDSPQTQFIEGARNEIKPYGVVPICLGTNRFFPPQAAKPYQETANNKQYVRQVFCWGVGQEYELEDIKIGETAIADYRGVDIEHKLNGDLGDGIDIFPNDVFQDDYSILVVSTDGYISRTTRDSADEAVVDFTFTRGLVYFNPKGQKQQTSVVLEIEYKLASDISWTSYGSVTYTEATSAAVRRSERIVFPERGQYDIRVRRLTDEPILSGVFDEVYWTAIKTFTNRPPINMDYVNGTAIRILGTDQLNGALDLLNAVVSHKIPDYDSGSGTWIRRKTSNPASIYRYILQGEANAKPVADARVDIAALESWHTHCESKGYSYNRMIETETSLYEVLKDVASAGRASPTILDGKFSVVVDKEKTDIVQIVTPRNSWGYSAELIYPDLPHAFRVQFRNKNKGYIVDERIVYDDGYDESNATKFEVLEYLNCTDPDLAYIHGRDHIATARLRPEKHMFTMDVENIVMTRGDRFKLAHDVPVVGVGDGRVKTLITSGSNIVGFTIDDVAEFRSGLTYYVRIRKADFSQLYLSLGTALSGSLNTFTLVNPIAISGGFEVGDMCYFVEAGGELDLIVSRIEPQSDLTAKITAFDYAPAIFTAATGIIPEFDSNITIPLSLQRPFAPILASAPISDESVMSRNSDGSYTSKMVITLTNTNDGEVSPVVIYRLTGTDTFSPATILESSPERVAVSGLDDGLNYDIWISYRRNGTTLQSLPLQLNNYKFVGASSLPDNVSNFRSNIAGGLITLSWDANDDIDISHYAIKFSRAFSGVTWGSAQDLEPIVNETRITLPFIGGTYLIKAVDILGNESSSATTIVTYESIVANVVATPTENPAWAGVKDNVELVSGGLRLIDNSAVGYYYFDNSVDLTGIYENQLSASIASTGEFTYDIYSATDIYSLGDIYGGDGGIDIYSLVDIYSAADLYGGAGESGWTAKLQMRTTQDDPTGSPTWSDWSDFVAGRNTFWGAEFRIMMAASEPNISPQVSAASVVVDMPDRIERGEDVTVPVSGLNVTFSPAFKEVPAIPAPSIQDGVEGDRIEFTFKTAGGFGVKVYNDVTNAYVERIIDWIASGYGRVN